MTNPHKLEALRELRDLIERKCGLAFPDRQLDVLERKLEPVLDTLGVTSFEAAAELLRRPGEPPPPELMQALTIGETYFFRNRAQFDALQQAILLGAGSKLRHDEPLVVWSAGCATGEEAYSLAMWILENARHLWPRRIRIVATDLNRESLAKARRGIYSEWSLRQAEDSWRHRYFAAHGRGVKIDDRLARVIEWREHNLVSDVLPPGLSPGKTHLVLCRNVLIYFLAERATRVIELFRRALAPDGVLIVGHSESLPVLRTWRLTYHQGTYTYQPPEVQNLVRPAPGSTAGRKDSLTGTVNAAASAIESAREQPSPSSRTTLTEPGVEPISCRAEGDFAEAAAPSDNPRDGGLERARRAANSGDLNEARKLLDAYTRTHKTCAEGHFLSAVVCEQLGDWEAARASAKRSLFLEKNLVVGHYLMAVMLERKGAQADARRHYRTVCRLLRDESYDAELPLGEGMTAGRLRELSDARIAELSEQGS